MVSQFTFSRIAFEQWLAKFPPSNTVQVDISPTDDSVGTAFPMSLFEYWVRLEVSPVPMQEMKGRLMVLYEHPVIVMAPNWFYYVVNNMLSLCEIEDGKVPTWGQLQDALEVLNEGDAKLRMGLTMLCNRKKFLEYCNEVGRLAIDHFAQGYEGPGLIVVLKDYAEQIGIEFDEISFYLGKLIIKIEDLFYAEQVAIPRWWKDLGQKIDAWRVEHEGQSLALDYATCTTLLRGERLK